MKSKNTIIAAFLLLFGLGLCMASSAQKPGEAIINQSDSNSIISNSENMKLGAFSVSLSVKDITVSQEFYENLGFIVFAGDINQNYLIMKNGNTLIGLFQGMFQGNMLTFNPGWDENGQNLKEFTDIRKIQRHLKDSGIDINPEADENTTGPASFIVTDPDGNVLLFDQHR